jgi:basic membrane protein A
MAVVEGCRVLATSSAERCPSSAGIPQKGDLVMHDHTGGEPKRVRRLGVRTTAGLGALSLLAAGLTIGMSSIPAGAKVNKHAVFQACEVTDVGGLGDKSFNYSADQGLLEAQTAAGGSSKMSTSVIQTPSSGGTSTYASEIQTFISQGCNIIVTVGYLMDGATASAATANPSQKFAIVDDVPSTTSKEVDSLTYQTNQSAFLGGALSAAESHTGVVATYGGVKIPPVTIYMDGFVAGVRWYDKTYHKHVKVYGWTPKPGRNYADGLYDGSGSFTGNFTSQADGQKLSKTFYSLEHADIVFPVAGNVGLGSVAAAKAAGPGHYVDWVDTDGCVSAHQDCSYFPMSVCKGIATSVKNAILSAFNGTFKGQVYVGTLQNGGASLVVDTHSKLKETTADKAIVSKATTGIEKGKISVDPNTYPVVP